MLFLASHILIYFLEWERKGWAHTWPADTPVAPRWCERDVGCELGQKKPGGLSSTALPPLLVPSGAMVGLHWGVTHWATRLVVRRERGWQWSMVLCPLLN